MPVTLVVDREQRLVRLTLSGTLTTGDMLLAIDRAAREAGGPGLDVFSDHRRLDQPATPEQIHAVVEHIGSDTPAFHGARWAIVVGRAVSYGMMRMLAAYAAAIPMEVQVFTDPTEAEAWLAAPRGAPDPPAAG